MPKAIRSQVTCAALVLLSMALVGWIRLLPHDLGIVDERSQARTRRSEMTHTAADGREHVYLGDLDSYLFLRHARNYLRTGTPCDAVVDGACRDTYTNAPVGARTPYARSLHVAAIVGVHKFITWFRPLYPLPSSAFFVPVIVGVLGVLPAFFIARSLAGATAGVFAGILTAIHPIVLSRTIGSDNDVWNVVLPLYMAWATMGALSAVTSRRGALWAGLAGVTVGLQAWAWRGWPFAYVVVTAGLVSAALAHAARYGIRHRIPRIWQAPDIRRIVLVLVVFYLVAGAAVSLTGSEEPYLSIPVKAVGALIRAIGGDAPDGRDAMSDWPNTLTSVAELVHLPASEMARVMGGTAAFLVSVVGLLLLLLPVDRWRWWHHAVLGTGALVFGYGLVGIEPSRVALLAVLTAPLAAAAIMQWWADEEPPAARRGVALVVVVWFLAAVATAFDGLRFLVLLAPPFGIACAVVIGRLDAWIRRPISTMPGWYRPVGAWVLGGVLVLALLHPVYWGHAAARRYVPMMRDTWWDALTHLRDTAQPDAIVHTWWDYGHWVKYVAERRVSNDGTSLQTHIPHWLARALVAPTEAQSVGVLRMLSCGSDAIPLPEGARGAYGKLRDGGRDHVTAYAIVSDLVTLDEAAGTAYLSQRGVTPGERVDILRSTHCHPTDGYLVLSSALLSRRQTWMSLGLWDPRREESMPNARDRSPAAEPPAVLFVSNWLPCRAARQGGDMTCDVQLTMGRRGSVLHTFTYRSAAPRDARLHVRGRGEAPFSNATTEGTPAAVLVAAADRMEEVNFASPTHPDVAVLIDVPGERILVGASSFLRSTFVHLMYLDGRYARHYRKHDDRAGLNERVVTWKIQWEGT